MTQIIVLDEAYVGLTALMTVGIQLAGYFVAYCFQIDKITDFLGSMNYVANVLVALFLGGRLDARQIYLSTAVVIARLYLGLYLLYRVVKRGHDGRFDGFRDKPLPFLGFWVFQMIWVWCNTLPIVMVNSTQRDVPLNAWDGVGIALIAIGLFYEVVGDQQKQAWKSSRSKDAVLCDVGLWGHTRHPNYFGEICIWLGMFLACVPVILQEAGWWWIGLLCPVTTIVILLFLGGLPTAEGSALKAFYKDSHKRQVWEAYKRRTSILFPFPPALYAAMPMWLKRAICLEWKLYEYTPEDEESSETLSPGASNSDRQQRAYGATAQSAKVSAQADAGEWK